MKACKCLLRFPLKSASLWKSVGFVGVRFVGKGLGGDGTVVRQHFDGNSRLINAPGAPGLLEPSCVPCVQLVPGPLLRRIASRSPGARLLSPGGSAR